MEDEALFPHWKLKHFLDSLPPLPQGQCQVLGRMGPSGREDSELEVNGRSGPIYRIPDPPWWQVTCLASSSFSFLAWKRGKGAAPEQPGKGAAVLEESG